MSEPTFPLAALSRLRMAIDGVGVTTLVCGTGCPLRCRLCINAQLLSTAKPMEVTPRQLYDLLRQDDIYFQATGGGPTFGGGEGLLHLDFIEAFRPLAPRWHITAETSLQVPPDWIPRAARCVDAFVVDIKTLDREIYRRYTDGDVDAAAGNLRRLLELCGPGRIRVRAPVIPGFADEASRRETVRQLREMGVTDIDEFTYIDPAERKK